jgi:hypothetical protein
MQEKDLHCFIMSNKLQSVYTDRRIAYRVAAKRNNRVGTGNIHGTIRFQ